MINQEELFLHNEKVLDLRRDFPLLTAHPDLIYFDNAATTQKPKSVLWAQQNWYTNLNANPFRGMYELSARSTSKYEWSRQKVAQFVGAKPEEIIFTSGATAGINMLALMLEEKIYDGDEIVVTIMEHHSNMLPWRELARRRKARIVYAAPDETGEIDWRAVLSPKTKIVAVTGMSNVLGQTVDIEKMVTLAHQLGAYVVMDAAQLIAHAQIDVRQLGVDALAFSGHKLYGPMGIGVLYIKESLAASLRPVFTGGEMIETVSRDDYTLSPLPHRFEAGTVDAAGAVGLAAALDYLQELGWENITVREKMLTEYLIKNISSIGGIKILGSLQSQDHCGLVSFTLEGVHPHDVATILASEKIAVRAGHHCAAVLHQHLGIAASVRVSLSWYNLTSEIDRFCEVLASVRQRMGL